MKRPQLIDFGEAACGTTFPGGLLTIKKRLDAQDLAEPLNNVEFTAYWRFRTETGTLVQETGLQIVDTNSVVLPSFNLFEVPGEYFLTIISSTPGSDKFEIYRAKIKLAAAANS